MDNDDWRVTKTTRTEYELQSDQHTEVEETRIFGSLYHEVVKRRTFSNVVSEEKTVFDGREVHHYTRTHGSSLGSPSSTPRSPLGSLTTGKMTERTAFGSQHGGIAVD